MREYWDLGDLSNLQKHTEQKRAYKQGTAGCPVILQWIGHIYVLLQDYLDYSPDYS